MDNFSEKSMGQNKWPDSIFKDHHANYKQCSQSLSACQTNLT